MVTIVVHDPLIELRIFTEKELEVDENKEIEDIMDEILSTLTKKGSYGTQFDGQQVTIERQPPKSKDASFAVAASSSITKQLVHRFGRREHKHDLQTFREFFNRPIPYLLGPASTFGDESQMEEVAGEFVSMMRRTRLDNKRSLREQGITAMSRIYLSIDIDAAIRCSTCNKPMKLGHLYDSSGTDLAGIYVQLDAFCSDCGWQRNIESLPPAVVSVQDKIRGKEQGSREQGTQIVILARDHLWKEQLEKERRNKGFF